MFGLSAIWTYLIGGAAIAIVAFGGGFYLEDRLKEATIAEMKLADANALNAAIKASSAAQQAQDKVSEDAAVKEAQAQIKVQTVTQTITKEIPKYVTVKGDTVSCIPVGLERLLYASASSADPDSLQTPSGQSNDACSDITATEVASWFKDYASQSIANAEQLNALEASVIAIHDAKGK